MKRAVLFVARDNRVRAGTADLLMISTVGDKATDGLAQTEMFG